MFEKFTQKAIDIVQAAQNYTQEFNHSRVLSQHLLMGLVAQSKGVQAKILNFDKIHFGELSIEVHSSAPSDPNRKKDDNIFFSSEARDILKSAVELTRFLLAMLKRQPSTATALIEFEVVSISTPFRIGLLSS